MRNVEFPWEESCVFREVSSFQRVQWYVQASMELAPEDVSLLERCPHFRGWYVQASMEFESEDVSLSFQRVIYRIQWEFEMSPSIYM